MAVAPYSSPIRDAARRPSNSMQFESPGHGCNPIAIIPVTNPEHDLPNVSINGEGGPSRQGCNDSEDEGNNFLNAMREPDSIMAITNTITKPRKHPRRAKRVKGGERKWKIWKSMRHIFLTFWVSLVGPNDLERQS